MRNVFANILARVVCQNSLVVVMRPNIKATRSARWSRRAERRTGKGIIQEQLASMQPDMADILEEKRQNDLEMDRQYNYWDDESDYDDGYFCDPIIGTMSDDECRRAEGVEVINICAVIDMIFGEESWRREISWNVRNAAIRAYAEEIGAALYSAPRECYSDYAARLTAIKAGKLKVIAEDLS